MEWTSEERLRLVGKILNFLRSRSMQQRGTSPGEPNHETALMIALAPAEFLDSQNKNGEIERYLDKYPDGLPTVLEIIDFAEGRGTFVGPR